MHSINIPLLFKSMILILLILGYITTTYEYHEKEKLDGYVTYKRQVNIYSPTQGYISEISVKNHSKVNKGDTFLEIDNVSEFQSTLLDENVSTLLKSSTQSKINLVDKMLSLTLNNISVTRKELESRLNHTKKIIYDYESSLSMKKEIYRQEKSRASSDMILFNRDLISESDVEVRKQQLSNVYSDLITTEATIKEYIISKKDIEKKLKELDIEKLNSIESSATEKTTYKYELASYNQNSSSKLKLVDSGILELSNLKVGQRINEGQFLAKTILDTTRVVHLNVLKENLALISIGDAIVVEIEALPFSEYGLFKGQVYNIFDVSDIDSEITRVIEIEITSSIQSNIDLKLLKNGMSASAYVNKNSTTFLEFFFLPIIKTINIDIGISAI